MDQFWIKHDIENGRTFTITYNTSSRTVLKILAETNGVTSQCLKETEKEDKDLINQLAKCSDKIKELEQKILKKKEKISELKSKKNKLISENEYLKDKCKTLEASCIEAKLDIEGISESEHDLIVKCSELEKCMKIIKETLNKPNINNETKLSEIKKILS
jgi:DNA repair exonuclease SbcCD ATPase subunit